MKKIFSIGYVKIFLTASVAAFLFLLFKTIYSEIVTALKTPDEKMLLLEFNDAQKFLDSGQPEIKSLSIQLLTLLSAVLIFSVTYSEKIINCSQTKSHIRLTLVAGWIMLISAIVADGIGLAFNSYAIPNALVDIFIMEKEHRVSASFYEPAFSAIRAIIMSGVFFVIGLICIVVAGVVSIFAQEKAVLKT